MKREKLLVIVGIVLVLFLVLGTQSCTSVRSTERGVSIRFGKVQDNKDIHSGLNFKAPFIEKIKKYSIEPRQFELVVKPGVDGALTKDNQTVGVTVKVVWKYDDDRIIDIAKNYSEKGIENIIMTIAEASVKRVIGQLDIFSLAEKQEQLSVQTLAGVMSIINANVYPINVVDIQVTNFDWSDEFDKQISITMNRAQEVKQSYQELEKVKIDSQRAVVSAEAQRSAVIATAEGQKQASITKAEGEKQASIAKAEADLKVAELNAQAKKLEGEAIKFYNESLKVGLETELALRGLEIEKIRVTRWNGMYVPNNMYGPIPVDTAGGIKGY